MFTSAEVRPGVLAKASHWATNEAESPARRRSAQDLATGQAVALQSEPPTSAADLAAAGQRAELQREHLTSAALAAAG